MDMLKVTVLMPAYNVEKYIREAIESVLDQTFRDFELLIVNDGSTDRTVEIIKSYPDPRIVLISQQNGGVSAALNKGLKHARGEYIVRFDADDVCYPDRLRIQYDFMQSNPDYIIAGSEADYMTEDGESLFHYHCIGYSNEEIQNKVATSCPFVHSSVIFKKDPVLELGGYNEHAHTFEDHFLWIQLAKKGKACNMRKSLIKVRLNPSSVTIDEKWRSPEFRKIKKEAILSGSITVAEGEALLHIIRSQNTRKIKEGSYYGLLGKKYLLNNLQPGKARKNMRTAIKINPLKLETYILYALSFFPKKFIKFLYSLDSD